jgi:hypothetical protein
MKHAIIYHVGKLATVEPFGPVAESVEVYAPDIGLKLSNFWKINAYKDIDVWYAYITEEEANALFELKDIKAWTADTAKEAWKMAYESGVKDLIAVVEQSCRVCIEVEGKQKVLTVEEAKKIDPKASLAAEFDKADDVMLPIKVLTLWE